MAQQPESSSQQHGVDHEWERVLLLRRLDALERLVFGRPASAATSATGTPRRLLQPLKAKVDAISTSVTHAEGGGRYLQDLATQASSLGLFTLAPPTTGTTASVQNMALKESILHAASGEIDTTARLLSQVEALQQHVNPPYLRDIPQLTRRLSELEGTYMRQATEATLITERADSVRLHYSEAVNLLSQKFVHWDEQIAGLERRRASPP